MGIYSRFGGKDGVVDALYAEGFGFLCDGMSVLPKTGDPVLDLPTCLREYRQIALAHSTHYMVMFGGAVPDFQPSEASKQLSHDAFDRLVASVQGCVDAGEFTGSAPEIAHTLWSAIHGQVMLELAGINPLKDDPDKRYEDLLDTLISGLRAR